MKGGVVPHVPLTCALLGQHGRGVAVGTRTGNEYRRAARSELSEVSQCAEGILEVFDDMKKRKRRKGLVIDQKLAQIGATRIEPFSRCASDGTGVEVDAHGFVPSAGNDLHEVPFAAADFEE